MWSLHTHYLVVATMVSIIHRPHFSLYNEKDNAARRESAGQGAFFPYKVRREWTPRVYPPKRPKRVCLTNLITKAGYDHFHVEVSILTSQYTGQEEKSSNMFVMFHL